MLAKAKRNIRKAGSEKQCKRRNESRKGKADEIVELDEKMHFVQCSISKDTSFDHQCTNCKLLENVEDIILFKWRFASRNAIEKLET